MRTAPNWLLFGLALIGMGLTTYLTVSTWLGQDVAGCIVGSDCDVVLNSRWATLFGLPTSFWGFLAYASLAGISFIKRFDLHVKMAWTIALFGVLFSLYLTFISLIQLQAACPYCLTSLSLLVAILSIVTYQWLRKQPRFFWRRQALFTVCVGLVLILALHLYYAGTGSQTAENDEDPKLLALAEHLAKEDVEFYGAFWCSHCKKQKALFGASAHRLPYIECSPNGQRAPQATICGVMTIKSYPTWIIKGRRFTKVLSLKELGRLSGFTGEL